jgi:hypothetical protein
MRIVAAFGRSAIGALLASVSIAPAIRALHPAVRGPIPCGGRSSAQTRCSTLRNRVGAEAQPLPAGDPPAFLFASVQPITAPESWRRIYHGVEQCAGKKGDYDAIHWAVMEAPLFGLCTAGR